MPTGCLSHAHLMRSGEEQSRSRVRSGVAADPVSALAKVLAEQARLRVVSAVSGPPPEAAAHKAGEALGYHQWGLVRGVTGFGGRGGRFPRRHFTETGLQGKTLTLSLRVIGSWHWCRPLLDVGRAKRRFLRKGCSRRG